jgi:hypothetical protein
MQQVVQCPYCVEGDDFSAMTPRGEGQWFWCAKCAHVVIPERPSYQCNCAKCVKLFSRMASH